jgi:hypothetical protein
MDTFSSRIPLSNFLFFVLPFDEVRVKMGAFNRLQSSFSS